MMWALKLITDAASEPVTVDEAKTLAHVDTSITTEDTLIGNLITTARKHAESLTRRAFISQTWRLTLDTFPFGTAIEAAIPIPLPPLATVTTVAYDDVDGVAQTVSSSDYRVLTDFEPGLLVPVFNVVWPATLTQVGAVRITFTCGYGASASYVPEKIKTAIKWLVAYWIENRLPTTEIPAAFSLMLSDFIHAGTVSYSYGA